MDEGEARAWYERLVTDLGESYLAEGDPCIHVLRSYLRWRGLPTCVARLRPEERADEPNLEHVSRHFTVLGYPADGYLAYCTLGACLKPIPKLRMPPEGGRVRYEYILHAPGDLGARASELLLMLAAYPFLVGNTLRAGDVLPLGEPVVEGSAIDHLYLTYPYLDDPDIYTDHPRGQIERGGLLIQTLWALPIHSSEARFVEANGPDEFESLLHKHHRPHYDGWDFARAPYV